MDHLYKITFWPITSKLTHTKLYLYVVQLGVNVADFEIFREIKMLWSF